jgi:hypothetical protein
VHGGQYIDEPLIFDKDTNDDGPLTKRFSACGTPNYADR